MVQGVEDLRTPLQEIIDLDKELRGTLTGFMMPNFVVDLPGGGGKRLVSTHEDYDEATGIAKYKAPGLPGKKGQTEYEYFDPQPVSTEELLAFRQQQQQALKEEKTLQEVIQSSADPPPQQSVQSTVQPETSSHQSIERLAQAPGPSRHPTNLKVAGSEPKPLVRPCQSPLSKPSQAPSGWFPTEPSTARASHQHP